MEGDWRKQLQQAQVDGERLEKMAHDLGIANLPFRVEPYTRLLNWTVWGKSLSDFSGRVLMVAKMLGRPPDATEKRAECGSVILKARWVLDKLDEDDWGNDEISVEGWSTTDCKVIVGGEEITKTSKNRVHPECVEVVDRLEDLDEGDWKDAPSKYAEASL
ncbi:MAG: hypothetical protein KAV00_01975 [Phycisphaerae bacterium]|nr:hypothetical protein [Phycisphaerae bacterium]